MKKFYCWLGLFALVAFSSMMYADDENENSEPSYTLGAGSLGNGKIKVAPGMPNYDATGRPYQWIPKDGGGAVLGPVVPNAYGPGQGADATGQPVKAVPWP